MASSTKSPEGQDVLAFEEEPVYPPVSALDGQVPAPAVQGRSGHVYHSTAFGCLLPHHLPRRIAIAIAESPAFDPLILVTIIANCITMAMSSPLDPPGTRKEAVLNVLEWVYLAIFTFEMMSKMLAYGLIGHHHSYLRDAWCQLDFVVVVLSWVPIVFPAVGDVSAVRSVRALRPLRALKRVPGMPVLVGAILNAMPALGNVAGLAGFVFMVFGIVGVELFKGVLHQRCAEAGLAEFLEGDGPHRALGVAHADDGAHTSALGEANATVAGLLRTAAAVATAQAAHLAGDPHAHHMHADGPWARGTSAHGSWQNGQWLRATPVRAEPGVPPRRLRGGGGGSSGADRAAALDPSLAFDTGTFCNGDASVCDLDGGETCHYFDFEPEGGTASFDSVAKAIIPLLQAVTFDVWTAAMFDVMAAYSSWAWIYFVAAAVFGGMFVVNLFLAVIFDEFMRAQAADDAKKQVTMPAAAPQEATSSDALALPPAPHLTPPPSPPGVVAVPHIKIAASPPPAANQPKAPPMATCAPVAATAKRTALAIDPSRPPTVPSMAAYRDNTPPSATSLGPVPAPNLAPVPSMAAYRDNTPPSATSLGPMPPSNLGLSPQAAHRTQRTSYDDLSPFLTTSSNDTAQTSKAKAVRTNRSLATLDEASGVAPLLQSSAELSDGHSTSSAHPAAPPASEPSRYNGLRGEPTSTASRADGDRKGCCDCQPTGPGWRMVCNLPSTHHQAQPCRPETTPSNGIC